MAEGSRRQRRPREASKALRELISLEEAATEEDEEMLEERASESEPGNPPFSVLVVCFVDTGSGGECLSVDVCRLVTFDGPQGI